MIGFRDGGCLARRRGKSVVALLIVASVLGVPWAGAQEPGAVLQYNGLIIENVTIWLVLPPQAHERRHSYYGRYHQATDNGDNCG